MHVNNTENDAVQMALTEAKDRISSMALVHEKLYKSKNLSNINLPDYVNDLVIHLLDNADVEVEPYINVEEIELNIETVIPLGLIFNELITNSIKYAFNWNDEKRINISITRADNKIEVSYKDNGPGLPEGFDIDNIESLGLNLVQILVLQLHGKLEVSNDNGATFKFEFYLG